MFSLGFIDRCEVSRVGDGDGDGDGDGVDDGDGDGDGDGDLLCGSKRKIGQRAADFSSIEMILHKIKKLVCFTLLYYKTDKRVSRLPFI